MEQVMGIEPTRSAWEAEVLPLNYTCKGLSTGLSIHYSIQIPENCQYPLRISGKIGRSVQLFFSEISFSSLCLTRWSALSMLLTCRPRFLAISW